FLHFLRPARRGRAPGAAHGGAISHGDDRRPAAPVLGSRGERERLRGRCVLRRRAGTVGRALRGGERLLRSFGAVWLAVRRNGGRPSPPGPANGPDRSRGPGRGAPPRPAP